jgi:hypothetical protein
MMAKKTSSKPIQEPTEFVLIDGQQVPLAPLAQREKNNLEGQRSNRVARLEDLHSRAMRHLLQFAECPDDQIHLLFNNAVFVFRQTIRGVIEVRHAEHQAREFNATVGPEMQIPFVFDTERRVLEAAGAAVDLLCKLGNEVSLNTVPIRIAMQEMRTLIKATPDLHSYHNLEGDNWPEIIHTMGWHLSTDNMGRVIAAGAQADDAIGRLRSALSERIKKLGRQVAGDGVKPPTPIDAPHEWTPWTKTKQAKVWFRDHVTSGSGWTDFANRMVARGYIVRKPDSGGREVQIHTSCFSLYGIPFPS